MKITNKVYVDEMPIYEFLTNDLPAALKGITGEATSTQVIGDKTFVKNWIPTAEERVELAKGKRITIRELKAKRQAAGIGAVEAAIQ